MNYSNAFRRDFDYFTTNSPTVSQSDLKVRDYDTTNILCYIKGTHMLRPTVVPHSLCKDLVVPLKGPGQSPTERITKAEEIISPQSPQCIRKVLLGDVLYYVTSGYIFNADKTPILITCFNTTAMRDPCVLCFDYSVFENPEEPVHRFLMRKFIPFLLEERKRGATSIRYMFTNNNAFIIKPNFQNELDHNLVGEFLAKRIQYECGVNNI